MSEANDSILEQAELLAKELDIFPASERDKRAGKAIAYLLGRLEAAERTATGLRKLIDVVRSQAHENI